jgi:hypothetical protein
MSTRSTFDLSQPHYKDSALQSEDIVERDDGVRRTLMRSDLKSRFTNIEEFKQKPR